MQKFALTVFKAFPFAALYQTATFPGFFGGLVDRRQPRNQRALSNCPPLHSAYTRQA